MSHTLEFFDELSRRGHQPLLQAQYLLKRLDEFPADSGRCHTRSLPCFHALNAW